MRPPNQTLNAIGAWNVAIQRQMTNSMTLDIAYVGNFGSSRVQRTESATTPTRSTSRTGR